jgi:anti-anti-sigma factor
MTANKYFRADRVGDVLVVTFLQSAGSASAGEIGAEFKQMRSALDEPQTVGVVVDFTDAPYFGSAVIEILLRFWSPLSKRQGKMALCNVSSPGRQVLKVCKFDLLWEIFASRDQAVQAVSG